MRFILRKTYLSFIFVLFFPIVALANFSNKYEALYNPLPEENQLFCPTTICDLQQFVLMVFRDILQLIPIISVIFIIIGSYKMVMSQGNEERLAEAKRTVFWAVMGLVVALLSFSIVAIVKNLLQVNV